MSHSASLLSHPLRALFFALLLTLASDVSASCAEIAHYRDSTMSLDISDGGCTTSTVKITRLSVVNDEIQQSPKVELEFDEECAFLGDNRQTFECKLNPDNPLSGATYQEFEDGFYDCGEEFGEIPNYVYRCINGCDNAPKQLNQYIDCC